MSYLSDMLQIMVSMEKFQEIERESEKLKVNSDEFLDIFEKCMKDADPENPTDSQRDMVHELATNIIPAMIEWRQASLNVSTQLTKFKYKYYLGDINEESR